MLTWTMGSFVGLPAIEQEPETRGGLNSPPTVMSISSPRIAHLEGAHNASVLSSHHADCGAILIHRGYAVSLHGKGHAG